MRILVLWTQLSGYMRACLDSLGQIPGIDLHVVSMPPDPNATFEDHEVTPTAATCYRLAQGLDLAALHDRLEPDALVVCSWNIGAYRRIARRSSALRILAMDNQWLGTLKQRLGILVSPWLIQQAYDRAFVPGDRAAQFASRLGFSHDAIWHGSYSGDSLAFAPPAPSRELHRSFIFVGRLVPEKGVDILLKAYTRYRATVQSPWSLTVCGAGPLVDHVRAAAGVVHHGFLQPSSLPSVFHNSGAFVLPSRFEPWGVVVHEACAAGLPIICTNACGAVPCLVQDQWNGFIVETGSTESLTVALRRVHEQDAAQRAEMVQSSLEVARRYSPQLWARTLLARLEWHSDQRMPASRRIGRSYSGRYEGSGASRPPASIDPRTAPPGTPLSR